MARKPPEVELDTHHASGTAEISISLRLNADEREGLIERLLKQKTVLHDRRQTVEALQLVGNAGQPQSETSKKQAVLTLDELSSEVPVLE